MACSRNDLHMTKPILHRYYISEDFEMTFLLYQMLLENQFQFFGELIFLYALGYIQRTLQSNFVEVISFATSLFGSSFDSIFSSLPQSYKNGSLVRFHSTDNLIDRKELCSSWTADPAQYLVSFIQNFEEYCMTGEMCESLSLMFGVTTILSHLSTPYEPVATALVKQINFLTNILKNSPQNMKIDNEYITGKSDFIIKSMLGHVITELVRFTVHSLNESNLLSFWDVIVDACLLSTNNIMLLAGLAEYLEAVKRTDDNALESKSTDKLLSTVQLNIGSFEPELRLHSLRILSCFYSKIHNVFDLCLEIERKSKNLSTIRDIIIILRKLESIVQCSNGENIPEVVTRYVMTLFAVNFAPLWPETTKTLQCCSEASSKSFWAIFHDFWRKISCENFEAVPNVTLKQIESHEDINLNKTDASSDSRNKSYICTNLESVKFLLNRVLLENMNPKKQLITHFIQVKYQTK